MRNSLYASMMVLFIAAASAPASAEDPGRAAVQRGGETTVVFVAHDYGFSGPERIPGGLHDRSDSE